MAPERQPFYKHFPADWRGDANLRLCSLAARGLWQECLGLMHEAEPRGFLLLSVEQLALVVSRPLKEVRAALSEIERNGVSSRDAAGRLFSRRMVRDTLRSLTLAANGRRGGSPILLNQELNQRDERLDKPLVKSASARTELLSTEDLSTKVLDPELVPPGTELLQARFERFWEAYPRKTNKKTALKAFVALKPDVALFTQLLDAIEAQKRSRQWREGFVPHAATWLHQERWTDEILPDGGPLGALDRADVAAGLAAIFGSHDGVNGTGSAAANGPRDGRDAERQG